MTLTPNAQLQYLEVPVGLPVPGKTLGKKESSIDLDNVPLNGGLLLKNLALSLDPFQRGMMRDSKGKSYVADLVPGAIIKGYGVGEVLRSEHEKFKKGQVIYGFVEHAQYTILGGDALNAFSGFRVMENKEKLPWSTVIGSAGVPGQTAWWGYHNIGAPKKGETIFVTGAAGAVGQVVAQLAKRDGLKVIGSAGSDDKVKWLLEEAGFDVAFNYKTQSTLEILEKNPPDIYFDNVGGEVLDNVLETMKPFGRIIACGGISQYNVPAGQQYGLKNSMAVVTKELTYRGFLLINKDLEEFYRTVPGWIAAGEIKTLEAITHGIDNGEAFVNMLTGKGVGKAVVIP